MNARKFAVDGLLLLCMGSGKREKEKKDHFFCDRRNKFSIFINFFYSKKQ